MARGLLAPSIRPCAARPAGRRPPLLPTATLAAELPARRAPTRALLASAVLLLGDAGRAHAFGFDDVAARARELAGKPHVAGPVVLPQDLVKLSYDEYRDIRFNPQRALWRDLSLPFELQFFHLGKFQTQPVAINEVTERGARRIRFDARD